MKSRTEALRDIASHCYDVCVIGAGATGSGCALDAQLRGLRTALVDAGDFASATSSASTKLVHGGVRYLQQAVTDFDLGQFHVVKRALHERILLLQNAPHLAHPLELLVPCRTRLEVLYYSFGMKLYDSIAGWGSLGRSRILSHDEALSRMPMLSAEELAGAVASFDGQLDDARCGVTLVKSFAAAGGDVTNYLQLVAFEKSGDGKLSSAILEDRVAGGRLAVRARVFVNATGPYSDTIRSMASPGTPSRLVLSRGVHVLLPLDFHSTGEALLIPKTEDGRVIFAIPWLGRLLVGTTDRETTLDEELVVQRSEGEYLLNHLNRYVARRREIDEIVSAFAGIRPLVRSGHSRATKKLIRDHEVEVDGRSGLVSILGGKWTTYRAMAEDAINAVQRCLNQPVRGGLTKNYQLAGAKGYEADYWSVLARQSGLPESVARHLAGKFGTDAEEIIALVRQDYELQRPIVSGAPHVRGEVVYAIQHEMAISIEDILARRIGLQYYSWELAAEAAPVVATYLARELGWFEAQKAEAVQEYTSKIERMQVAIGHRSAPVPS